MVKHGELHRILYTLLASLKLALDYKHNGSIMVNSLLLGVILVTLFESENER